MAEQELLEACKGWEEGEVNNSTIFCSIASCCPEMCQSTFSCPLQLSFLDSEKMTKRSALCIV